MIGLLVRGFGRVLGNLVYRVKSIGLDRLPAGGCLLLPNHLTWVDAVILQLACPRPIRFIIERSIYEQPALHWLFKGVGAIPISSRQAKDAVREAAERIRAGELVCVFPEGELSRTGTLLRLKRGYELIARTADAPVVPVWLDQLWGSIFSFKGGRYFTKWPGAIPYPVAVAFGAPLAPAAADIATVRERFLELGEFCYSLRPALRGHLGRACIAGLKRHAGRIAVIEGTDGRTLTRGMLLAAGIALSREIKRRCPGKRVAIVLPPAQGAVIANLAVMLANKVPVNLNFTAGRDSVAAALRIGEIAHALTAGAVRKRLPDFPWPADVLALEELLPPLKTKIACWRLLVALLPASLLGALLGIPLVGDHAEAVLLFTSGSSGDPKGVVLSHRNLLGNVSQFGLMLNLTPADTLLASLPFFHSFGCTVTLWFPMIEQVRVVTYPNPLEVGKNAELIQKHGITVFLATPTFLRGYLRKATPAQLASLTLIVTGAEKLPRELAAAFQEKFGKKIYEGYGLTETSPVVSVNLPEPAAKTRRVGGREIAYSVQPSSRDGSTGKLAPGVAAQIRDPETGAPLSLHQTGMLWLRGPNIFAGYLGDPERSAAVVQAHWFQTGDLARFDEDGFLFIEGRLSRFSKIGGEMVPHETVEARIAQVLELGEGERSLAIAAVPDEAKGEALVLLAAIPIDLPALRTKLAAAGLANLWIPRQVKPVEAIPVLASGKLDLKRCQELALEN